MEDPGITEVCVQRLYLDGMQIPKMTIVTKLSHSCVYTISEILQGLWSDLGTEVPLTLTNCVSSKLGLIPSKLSSRRTFRMKKECLGIEAAIFPPFLYGSPYVALSKSKQVIFTLFVLFCFYLLCRKETLYKIAYRIFFSDFPNSLVPASSKY